MRNPATAIVLGALLAAGCEPASEPAATNDSASAISSYREPPPDPQPTETASAAPLLNLATDGLTLVDPATGSSRQLAFGMAQFQATQAIGKAIGSFTGQAENPECGAGALTSFDYPGGLTLFFQQKKFVGWDFDGEGKYATANGIGIGTSYAELKAAGPVKLEETSIGHEFDVDGLSGLLGAVTPAGKVTNLWAGTTCIFR